MVKCGVRCTRNESAGSSSVAVSATAAVNTTSATPPARAPSTDRQVRRTRGAAAAPLHACPDDIFEEHEIGEWGQMDAGERPARDRHVPLVPQADVRQLAR